MTRLTPRNTTPAQRAAIIRDAHTKLAQHQAMDARTGRSLSVRSCLIMRDWTVDTYASAVWDAAANILESETP